LLNIQWVITDSFTELLVSPAQQVKHRHTVT